MFKFNIYDILIFIQHGISLAGILVILSGILLAIYQYLYYFVRGEIISKGSEINVIRLNLSRILILGLEFIIAADLISTTTTPDYYAVGIVASIVVIRTLLSFTLNREIIALSSESAVNK